MTWLTYCQCGLDYSAIVSYIAWSLSYHKTCKEVNTVIVLCAERNFIQFRVCLLYISPVRCKTIPTDRSLSPYVLPVGIWVTIIMYQARRLALFRGRAIMVLWFMLNCLLYDVND